jgi:hypothetical protein
MARPIGFHADYLASARYGESQKVTVTAGATLVLDSSSSQVGVVVRVISLAGASLVSFGGSTITNDAGAKPGAHGLTAANSGLTLNITGDIYGICDAGSAVLAVTPLLADGFGPSNIS